MEGREKESSIILDEILKNFKESFESIFDIVMKLNLKIEEKAEYFKIQLENAYKIPVQTDGSGYLEEKVKNLTNEKEFLVKQHEDDKQFLLDKIERLEKENKVMTDKLIKSAKGLTTNELNKNNNTVKFNINTNNMGGDYQNVPTTYIDTHQSKKNNNVSVIVAPTGSKLITKKSIREMIDEMYDSKTHFDKKCIDNKMPKETMEQHMYTFLNHKYGLKVMRFSYKFRIW